MAGKIGNDGTDNRDWRDTKTAKAPMGKDYPQHSSGKGGSTPGFPKVGGMTNASRSKAKLYGG